MHMVVFEKKKETKGLLCITELNFNEEQECHSDLLRGRKQCLDSYTPSRFDIFMISVLNIEYCVS